MTVCTIIGACIISAVEQQRQQQQQQQQLHLSEGAAQEVCVRVFVLYLYYLVGSLCDPSSVSLSALIVVDLFLRLLCL